MYLGEINHRGKSFPAEHEPIIEKKDAIDRSREAKCRRRRLLRGSDRGRRASDVFEPSFLSCRDVLRSPRFLLEEPARALRTSAEAVPMARRRFKSSSLRKGLT